MFMKTSVPYSYKFLILVWTIPDSYFRRKLTIERFTKKQTNCNSGKLYTECAISCRDFRLFEILGGG